MAMTMTMEGDTLNQMVPLEQYALMVGKSSRTIYRHIEAGMIPGAYNDGTGWFVPVDELTTTAPPRVKLPKRDNDNGNVVDIVRPSSTVDLIGRLVELETYAAELGTTVGGVRRMAAAGLVTVGRFGPRGALRVFIPPRRS